MQVITKLCKLTIINGHAPTEEKDEDTKHLFHQQLKATYDAGPRYDVKIILGYMNAKIEKEVEYIGIIGKHSLYHE